MKGQKKLPQPNVTADTLREAKLRSAMTDMVRGGLLGATTDAVGYLPDAVADFMRPFGYNVAPQDVVGGTEWLANKFTTPTNSTPEKAARFVTGMMTPSPMDFARLGKGPMQELTVYHGSPHRINNVDEANPMGKFDLSKVGTGEGAQAYGHGIYLAENPNVARQYTTTGNIQQGATLNARARQTSQSNIDWLEKIQRGEIPRPNTSRGSVVSDEWIAAEIADNRAVLEKAEKWGKNNAPSFYTVDLPDEHIAKMLDWDAPLSQQPENIRAAFKRRITEPKAIDGMDMGGNARLRDNSHGQADPSQVQPWVLETQSANGPSKFGLSQKDVDRLIGGKDINALTGAQIYQRMAADHGGFPQASQMMRNLGIPGIKYFDGGSRSAGEGTRNFVIFDGDTAKILKRE